MIIYALILGVTLLGGAISFFVYHYYFIPIIAQLGLDIAEGIEVIILSLGQFAGKMIAKLFRFIEHLTKTLKSSAVHIAKNFAELGKLLFNSLQSVFTRVSSIYDQLLDFITGAGAKFIISIDGAIANLPSRIMGLLSRIAISVETLILQVIHDIIQALIDGLEIAINNIVFGFTAAFNFLNQEIQDDLQPFISGFNTDIIGPMTTIVHDFEILLGYAQTIADAISPIANFKALFEHIQSIVKPACEWYADFTGCDIPYPGDFACDRCPDGFQGY